LDDARRDVSTIGGLRAGLRSEVVGLAQWAACPPCRKPWVDAGSVESMTASQAAHIVVIFQGVDTYSAGITRRAHAFRWQSSIDMFVFVILVVGNLAEVLVRDSRVRVAVRAVRAVRVIGAVGLR
jgi:Zn-finger nucleic acid-binding protein